MYILDLFNLFISLLVTATTLDASRALEVEGKISLGDAK